jgi:hypothetical protein
LKSEVRAVPSLYTEKRKSSEMTKEQEQLKLEYQLGLLDELLESTTYDDVESGFASHLHRWRDELRLRTQQLTAEAA